MFEGSCPYINTVYYLRIFNDEVYREYLSLRDKFYLDLSYQYNKTVAELKSLNYYDLYLYLDMVFCEIFEKIP